ncbi:aminodeoxychorismate synthase component I [Pseudomonadales bacterium]|nr:aminodeoxychorismate synthase component I [Pseudomonadales bacterium]
MNTQPRANTVDIPYMQDSCRYFERLRHLPYPVLLDSNAQASAGRFDIITAAPASIISSKANSNKDALFAQINEKISTYTSCGASHVSAPFVSGAIGVFSYDLGMQLNDLDTHVSAPWPLLVVGVYQWAIVQDHQQQQSWLLSDPKQDQAITDGLMTLINNNQDNTAAESFTLTAPWQSSNNIESYNTRFNAAMNYIEQGDCYQVNVAQQMSAEYKGDSWQAYKKLRQTSPTPFAAYFETPQACLMSLSPERFIQVKDQQVQTQPIKGTRKRGATADEDKALIAELSSSEKDRAENLMIVDLMRNDLGKCCEQGSIKVPKLFDVESHPNVHHLVSTVTAKLCRTGVSASLELLKSSLPGGSVTGAPKKRAMEIIDELENFSRSIYCGSMVYIDNSGNMDSNILIRSLLLSRDDNQQTGTVKCWGGGGIVADSKAELEYEESLQKVRNILDALSDTR